jgi:hypothetical protein
MFCFCTPRQIFKTPGLLRLSEKIHYHPIEFTQTKLIWCELYPKNISRSWKMYSDNLEILFLEINRSKDWFRRRQVDFLQYFFNKKKKCFVVVGVKTVRAQVATFNVARHTRTYWKYWKRESWLSVEPALLLTMAVPFLHFFSYYFQFFYFFVFLNITRCYWGSEEGAPLFSRHSLFQHNGRAQREQNQGSFI